MSSVSAFNIYSIFDKTLSIYIPHVFSNITEERIKEIFETLCLGKIHYVDFIRKQGKYGNSFNSVYIHFYHWYDTVASRNLQEKIVNPCKEARLVYDDPWFWIVLKNTNEKSVILESRHNKTHCFAPKKAPLQNDKNIWDELKPIRLFDSENNENKALDMDVVDLEKMLKDINTTVSQECVDLVDTLYVKQLENQIQISKQEKDYATQQLSLLHAEIVELNNKVEDLENDYWLLETKNDLAEKTRAKMLDNCKIHEAEIVYLNNCIHSWKKNNHDKESEIAELIWKIDFWKEENQCKGAEIEYLREVLSQYEPNERCQNKELYH